MRSAGASRTRCLICRQCPLCLRPIPPGVPQSRHHLIPKLRGGKGGETVLLHHGMVIVGLPYAWQGQMTLAEISGGSPYGASTIAGGKGERQPRELIRALALLFPTVILLSAVGSLLGAGAAAASVGCSVAGASVDST